MGAGVLRLGLCLGARVQTLGVRVVGFRIGLWAHVGEDSVQVLLHYRGCVGAGSEICQSFQCSYRGLNYYRYYLGGFLIVITA